VSDMLRELNPNNPVYCIFPHVYRDNTKAFLEGFPGRVLYAVKANADPRVLGLLIESGIRHFDCASLPEIELVHRLCPDGSKYFMVPSRIRGAAKAAQDDFGVRHFMVDHASGIELLGAEIDLSRAVVFARMAVHHKAAMSDLSFRFGAEPKDMPGLLKSIHDSGAEPALAFNVGSSVTDPDAYRYAMDLTNDVLADLPFRIRLLDVGGGYPKSYPGFTVPHLGQYFRAVAESFAELPLAGNAEVLGEPGRALAAPGMSAVAEVLLRKDDRLFINDGMHGVFWELRYPGHNSYPARTFRDGQVLTGNEMSFTINGPTCDSDDTLPGQVELPRDIRPGDHIEFGCIGAYSLTGRTDFNGYYSDHVVTIT
ncbi:MAG: type III PLP-dependent enzyme, partial [Woeseiaceae bacterium]|nr:type III PLP-dependent enzyme [Woeseiaceae bacterium]